MTSEQAPTRRRRAKRVRENPPAELLYARKWKIFGVMMIGWFMSMLDVSIVNITIPELQDDLDASLSSVSWVVNAYNITFAVLLVGMGRLADQFGRRRFFVGGLFIFTVGSALCAAAWTVEALSAFRVVQGVGAGMLAPLGFAMTALVFPPEQRGKGLAMIAVVALVANGLGPVIGGVLLEFTTWHWVFLINIPLGIAGIVLALRWWPETYDLTAGRRIDWLGMLLLAAAVFSLSYGLVEGNVRGWGDASVLFFLQLSIFLGIGFYFSQRLGRAPMLTPRLLGNHQFLSANGAMLLLGAGAVGSLFMLSIVLINLWGYTPLEAALALLPIGVMGGLVWPIVGKGADTVPPYRLAMPALLSMAVGLLWFSFLPSTFEGQLDYILVLPGVLLIGAGIGTAFPALNVGAMGAAFGPELGVASGVVNTSRQVGSALGVAVLVAITAMTAGWHLDWKRDHIEDTAYVFAVPNEVAMGAVGHNIAEFTGAVHRREDAPHGFDRWLRREAAGIARDGYGWAFRVAALLLLLALPLARRVTRTPAMAMAEAQAAARAAAAAARGRGPPGGAGAAGPPAGAGAPTGAAGPPAGAGAPAQAPGAGVPATVAAGTRAGADGPAGADGEDAVQSRIAELEASLRALRAEVDGRDGPTGNGGGAR